MTKVAKDSKVTAGGAIFARLKRLGIDYVFCNSGTDFPPIIEGLAEAAAKDIDLPQAIVVPHEHAAMGMAHGHYQASGKTQAVMLHTNVGLANGVIGAINAAHDNVPVIIMSGRTPVTERGKFGSRTVPIGWGQEMFDQTALVRECCKWDYELKFSDQIVELLDRAWAIANSTPKGPVYLSLPREVLCETIDASLLDAEPIMQPAVTAARPEDIETLAQWIVEAENPTIFSQRGTGTQRGFDALTELVEDWALPINMYWATAAAVPSHHPMAIGDDPGPVISESDLIIVLDAVAPWMPDKHQPRADARIATIGPDPLFTRTPVRNFRSDLALPGAPDETIAALAKALERRATNAKIRQRIDKRRKAIELKSREVRQSSLDTAKCSNDHPITKSWVAQCLSEAIERSGRKASITAELGCPLSSLKVDHFNGFRAEPHSGGLGWGLPAALGMQLAEPDTLVFATMGDGSYIFANPTACHQIAETLELPVIICVLNNGEWGAVRNSVTGLYPDGFAAKANSMPLTSLQPLPDFAKIAEASRAHVETIDRGDDLPAALDRAIDIATDGRRHVLLNILIDGNKLQLSGEPSGQSGRMS